MIGRILAGLVASGALIAATATTAVADTARNRQWYLADLHITQAHSTTRGAGVTVALIDTGVDAEHRDLASAVLSGHDTHHSKWTGDGNGLTDSDGHGTTMAGIIAGRGHGSGDGILGIAPAAKLLPIRAPINEYGSSSFMTEAVDFAIAHHAGVINMSFGSPGDETMHQAIRKAEAADIVLVAASGNREGRPGDYPGKYSEVLTVGGYGRDHKIGPFSVAGPQVDMSAPGVDMATTSIGPTGYAVGSGTSEATAVVSGAAALLRAKFPEMSAAEVVHRLTATADDAGPAGRDDSYGYGRLNIVRALTADVAPLPATAAPAATSSGEAAAIPTPSSGDDLPKGANPLLLAAVLAGLVLLIGAIVVAVMLRRRKPTV